MCVTMWIIIPSYGCYIPWFVVKPKPGWAYPSLEVLRYNLHIYHDTQLHYLNDGRILGKLQFSSVLEWKVWLTAWLNRRIFFAIWQSTSSTSQVPQSVIGGECSTL